MLFLNLNKKVISSVLAFSLCTSIMTPMSAYATETSDSDFVSSLKTATPTTAVSDNIFYIKDNSTNYVYKFFSVISEKSQYLDYTLSVASDNNVSKIYVLNNVDLTESKYNIASEKGVDTSTGANVVNGTFYLPANTPYYIGVGEKNIKTSYISSQTENILSLYAHTHQYKDITSGNSKYKYCAGCGQKHYYQNVSNVVLSSRQYSYNGKVRHPGVTVKNKNGNKISSKYYSVSYSKGCKKPGKYYVTVTMKQYPYMGKITKSYYIVPKGTSIKSLSKGKKKIYVKVNKQTAQIDGYQIQYSRSSKFKSGNKTTCINKKKTTKTIKNLKSKKWYYVRVRTYKQVTVDGKKKWYYSGWSKSKYVKTK